MLRKLKQKDAVRMHEWMHDEEVLRGLQAQIYRTKSLEDCKNFIAVAQDTTENCHMAIVNENDEYQGTVSLKMIDTKIHRDCEFAIVLRKDAFGQGYGKQAMSEIMDIAFNEYGLEEVYWNVKSDNYKALSLYRKGGYKEMSDVSERMLLRAPKNVGGGTEDVVFFHITRKDYLAAK